MKKLLTAGVALLSVATLAACSGKTASESSSKDSKASSSKVEKSSTSESKSSSSSKSATSSVDIPEIVLLTDDEIDNAKTLGDMKTIYGKMIDNYTKYLKEIGDKIPASGKEAYNKQVDAGIQSMETARKAFNESLSSLGSDDTVVPEQPRAQFAQQIKSARDIAQKALEGAYQSIAPLLSSSAE
ncbi:hypothetical protein ABVF55_07990 [Streptococcus sp. KHUD_012]|uniref:Lipoprotein n=1 Tax=Streptococcus lingualis TaxID=3098076 RepID=A0ABZ0SRS5_9STRE|nr:hypothetical protein [Streptococcus sp. S5]WPS46440.1 hypothetical protein SM123_07555 [Streptococcus sp. S5]